MKRRITARVRSSLEALVQAFDEEPVIFIDKKGRYWLNCHARSFLSGRKIPVNSFMEWLMMGSAHLQNLIYGDIRIRMMSLPEDDMIVFLGHENPPRERGKKALTAREREVLGHLAHGCSNKQIAELLKISPGTVNCHLDSIYWKLGCSSRAAACFLGLRKGLFLPSRPGVPATS